MRYTWLLVIPFFISSCACLVMDKFSEEQSYTYLTSLYDEEDLEIVYLDNKGKIHDLSWNKISESYLITNER